MEISHTEPEKKLGELYAVNIPIQMMAISDRDGRLTPRWFRYELPDHRIESVEIEKTISRDECRFVGIREKRFVCAVVIAGERKLIEIRYNIESQCWRIFQFLN